MDAQSRSPGRPRLVLAVGITAASLAAAVGLTALVVRTDPKPSITNSPSAPSLPDALLAQTWLATGESVAVAGTLGGSRLRLPDDERPIRASSGLVVSTDKPPGSPSDGSRLIVRDLTTGAQWPEWDTRTAIRWATNDSQRVLVAGFTPPAPGRSLDVPGVHQLLPDGSNDVVIEPREAPEAWRSMQLGRPLVLSTSGETLVAATCRWDGHTLGSQLCDVEVLDLDGGRQKQILRDVSSIPQKATDEVVLATTDSLVSAYSLETGETLWATPVSGAPSMYLSASGAHLYLARPSASTGHFQLDRLDVSSGASEMVWQWAEREGYLWDSLSWDTYAAIGPTPSIHDAMSAGPVKVLLVDTTEPTSRWEVTLRIDG